MLQGTDAINKDSGKESSSLCEMPPNQEDSGAY
jgi:hypothetical protein